MEGSWKAHGRLTCSRSGKERMCSLRISSIEPMRSVSSDAIARVSGDWPSASKGLMCVASFRLTLEKRSLPDEVWMIAGRSEAAKRLSAP